MASFTELEVWKQAAKIRRMVFELSKQFPPEENTG